MWFSASWAALDFSSCCAISTDNATSSSRITSCPKTTTDAQGHDAASSDRNARFVLTRPTDWYLEYRFNASYTSVRRRTHGTVHCCSGRRGYAQAETAPTVTTGASSAAVSNRTARCHQRYGAGACGRDGTVGQAVDHPESH